MKKPVGDRSLETLVFCRSFSDMSGCAEKVPCDCRIVSWQHTCDEFFSLIYEPGRVVGEVTGESGERLCRCRFEWAIIR